MTQQPHKGLIPAFSCMELFWIFAWADFMIGFTAKLRVPFFSFFAAYFISFALASELRRSNPRFIWRVLGHAILFSGMVLFSVWSATGRHFSFGADIFEWYQSCLILALAGIFWYKGTKLSSRQMSYKMVCNYFDLGMALFFSLLLIKLLIWYKTGSLIADSLFLFLLIGFFFMGLLAIFFSSVSTSHKKQYVEGFRGVGVLISFCAVFLLSGMGLIFILMPFLTSMAESGYMVLKAVSGPFAPYLIAVLRVILVVPGPKGNGAATARPDPEIKSPLYDWIPGEPGWVTEFVLYGALLVVGAAVLVLIGAIAWRVFQFLMLKPAPGTGAGEGDSLWSKIGRFLGTIMKFFQKIFFIFFGKIETAQTGFSKLMAWGRKSGMPRSPAETPDEYSKRLCKNFSALENEITAIVHAFHLEAYGEMKLAGAEITAMTGALKTIHSPSFWFMRVKTAVKRF